MEDIICAIDVGTTKICTVIAETNARERLRVIGIGIEPAQGMRKGMITNIEEATRAIAQSIAKAERAANYRIESAYIGITGEHIASITSRGRTSVGNGDRPITNADINHALDEAQAIAIPHDRQVLHALPQSYALDGQDGIRDPIGMVGYKLEVQAHIITASVTAIRNLVNCVQSAGVAVNDLVLQSLASAEAVLRPDERQMGVALVDIGGGTTDISIFLEGCVWHSHVLPVGGDHLTNDIAIGLRTPFAIAEELKVRYAHAVPSDIDADERIDINAFGDGARQMVLRADIAAIVHGRTEEILELVLREIKRTGYDGLLAAGIVLTGGSSDLSGFKDLARHQLDLPVRIGMPRGIGGLAAKLRAPAFATATGLLLWGAKYGVPPQRRFRPQTRGQEIMYNIGEWLKKLLAR